MSYREKSDEALKLYYSILEVSLKIMETTSCIRYWCDAFEIAPQRRAGKDRRFTAQEISDLLEIKRLLRDKHYEIEGAKAVFREVRQDWSRIGTPMKIA